MLRTLIALVSRRSSSPSRHGNAERSTRPQRVKRLLTPLLAVAVTVAMTAPAGAQEDTDEPAPVFSAGTKPLAVVTAASMNRLKQEADFLFRTAGAPDALDSILEALDNNVNGLQGLDWDRPAGIMVYLNGVFPPAFEFVAFLPIKSVEEFQSMMELGPVILREESTEEGRYELITPQRNLQIRIQNKYAFIQLPPMNPDPAFDRDLPDPGALVSGLTSQFDLAVSLDVESIPKGTRSLIFNVLSSTMSTQMQQRDDEPESQYELRRSWMQADIDGLKLLFDECRRISIGINVSEPEAGANIDFVLDVRDGSKMLEEIFASTKKPSYFIPLLSEDTPVSLTWSGVMAERDRTRYEEVLEALKGEVARGIEERDLGPVPDESSPLFHAISALQTTVREGHLDVFGQFYRDSADKLAVVGALRVQEGEAVASGLVDLLTRIQGLDDIGDIELAAREHQGISFHRVLIRKPDAGAHELFGNGPGVFIGCGDRSLWLCLGGDDSFKTLTGVMDQLVAAYENPTTREVPASLRLVVHTNELINLIQGAKAANRSARQEDVVAGTVAGGGNAEDDGQNSGGRGRPNPAFGSEENSRRNRLRQRREKDNAIIREALAEGDDRIQVEFRPTDSGMRMRAHFDLGFVRGIGRVIAARFQGD